MPTLVQYRQHAARSIGEFFSSQANGHLSTQAVLVDNTAPLQSSVRSSEFYKDWWLFRPNAGVAADQLRVVATDQPAIGTLTPDLAWGIAPGNNEKYELHGIVEPMTQMTELINQTLKRCFVTVELTLSPQSATATRQDLSLVQNGRILRPEWVRQVGFLAAGESRENINPYQRTIRGWASLDANTTTNPPAQPLEIATVYLNHPGVTFPTTATLYVLAIARTFDWCAPTAGSFGQQSGLNLDGDVAQPAVEWVTAGVLSEAWQRFGHIMDATSNQRLIRDQASAAQWFEAMTQRNFRCPPLTFRRLDWWAPLPVGPGVFSY